MELIAEVGSVEDRQNEYYTHFCNWAQSIHHPLDLPNSPFPRIRSVDQRLDLIRAFEIGPGFFDKGRIRLVLWHRSATVWDLIVFRNFFGRRVVSFGRYFVGAARRGPVR